MKKDEKVCPLLSIANTNSPTGVRYCQKEKCQFWVTPYGDKEHSKCALAEIALNLISPISVEIKD